MWMAVMLIANVGLAESDAKIFPYTVHQETLENGLKAIVIPMKSGGLTSYWSVVRTGSRDEYEPGHSGFAHFFEHMMFRGTEAYPADRYNEIITRMGADANAFTTDDLTAYHMSVGAQDLEQVVKIESDRFKNLSYAEEVFKTEAGAVYGEYRKNKMSPFFALYEQVYAEAFEQHTYGHTTMGYERDIAAMPTMFDYSRSFFNRYYRPENVVLLIVGDVDPAATLNLVTEHYADWEPGYVMPTIVAEPEQTEERKVSVDYEGRSLPIVWLAYKAPAFDPTDVDWVAAYLLGELAFGETSDIHKKLVLDEQRVQFVAGSLSINRDPTVFDIYSRVKDPEDIDAVIGELDSAVEYFREHPPAEDRLNALKSRMKYDFLMDLDTPDAVASTLARFVAITGGVECIDTLYGTMESVKPEDVQRAARGVLVKSARTVGVLQGAN